MSARRLLAALLVLVSCHSARDVDLVVAVDDRPKAGAGAPSPISRAPQPAINAFLASRSGQRLDANSLAPGDLSLSSWQLDAPTLAPVVRPLAAVAPNGTQSLVCVNCEQNTPLGGYEEMPFREPSGVTSVAFQIDNVALTQGDVSTGTSALRIYDATGLTQIATANCAPTSTATQCTTGAVTVTPGLEYKARLYTNLAGTQSRFQAGPARVVPLTSSDATWLATQRLALDATNLWINTKRGRTNARYPSQSPLSYVDLYTSAPWLKVEVYDSLSWKYPGQITAEVFVNGAPYASLTPTAGQDVSYQTVTMPTTIPAPWHVKIVTGTRTVAGATSAQQLDDAGLFLNAIYTPLGSYIEATSPGPALRISELADSKGVGFFASQMAGNSYKEEVARDGIEIRLTGAGSDALYFEGGSTVTDGGAVTSLAQALTASNPDAELFEITRNDFALGYFTPANIVTQSGNLLDNLHWANPRAPVIVQSWTHEATEGAVSGVAWDTERANLLGLCATRSPWCWKADAGGLWTSAMTAYMSSDSVHLSDAGHWRLARGLEAALVPGPVAVGTAGPATYDWPFKGSDTGASLWLESDVGAAPSSNWSAVTCVGTCSPTVQISGTPGAPGRIVWRIATGGTLGTATFDASIDGARSWAYRNVPTAASVTVFGATISFGAGTYVGASAGTPDYYYATNQPGNWADVAGPSGIAGSGIALTNTAASTPLPLGFGHNGVQSLRVTGGSGGIGQFTYTFSSIPEPYTLVWVGSLDVSGGSSQALLGRDNLSTGPLLYQNTAGNVLAWNAGTAITSGSTVNLTTPHCIIAVFNGASSSLTIDGTTTTGSTGTGALTGFSVGADLALSFTSAGYDDLVAVLPVSPTTSLTGAITARCRAKYGTP